MQNKKSLEAIIIIIFPSNNYLTHVLQHWISCILQNEKKNAEFELTVLL